MTEPSRKVIALGSPTGEHRAAIEAAARLAGAELAITRESTKALADIEQEGTLAVLVDMTALGAENFCRKARANERLRRVPIIGLSRNPGELSFNRIFAWGADDLVPLGAQESLALRLCALSDASVISDGGFGQAVVAEAQGERCALLGRVLTQAGYDVKYALDAASAEFYASQSETRVVVLNAALTPPRKLIETVEQSGALPVWVVIGEPRQLPKIAQGLNGIARAVVTSSSGSPEDVLFVANELVFSRANKRSEWRALYGTPVQFRDASSETHEFGFTYDVSPTGVYVRSLLPCEFSEVWVELRPPRRDKLVRLRGRVARRFRFGSGSIASAPPGFGLKLEGTEDDADLRTWVEACNEFLGAQGPHEVSGGAPVMGAKDGGFRKPTPLGTPRPALPEADVETKPRPIPADLRARGAVAAPTPAASPTAPLLAPDEIDEVLGMVDAPPASVGRESMHSDVGQMLAETLESESEKMPNAGALPVTMTIGSKAVYEAPVADVPPPDAPPAPPAAPATPKPAAVVATPKPAPAETKAEPPPPAVAAKPPVAVAQPPKFASAKATLMMGAAPPPPPARAGADKAPAPAPAPAAADTRRTSPATPPAIAREANVLPPPSSRRAVASAEANAPTLPAPPPGSPGFVSPPVPAAPSIPQALPPQSPQLAATALAAPPVPAPIAPAPIAPAPPPAPLPAAAWAAIAPGPQQPPAPRPSSRRPVILAAVLGFAAVVGAVAAGFLLGLIPPGGAAAQRSAAPERISTPSEVKSAAPELTATPSSTVTLGAAPPPAPSSTVAAAAPASSAPPSASVSAAASAPAAGAAAPATVDLSALAPTQGYLYVRSSVTQKVFVMGREVGDTNTPLVTSCGTRFVRMGRRLADFTEPGGAVIIKCGALTEIKREPR